MTISLSTRGFFDRSASVMTALTARAETLQTQVSTGKKLQSPSDDAVGYQRLQMLARAGADDGVYAANVKIAQGVLAQADTTLGDISAQLQRASELAVQAGNGTLSAEGKATIATQLRGVLDTIVSLANTKDARGQSLMGGATDAAAVTMAGGKLSFAEGTPSSVPIGDGQDVQVGVAAGDVLKLKDGRDIAEVLTAMAQALEAGETPGSRDAEDLSAIGEKAVAAQATVGARAVRVDLQAAYLSSAAIDREAARSATEDVDITQAITELQKTMTVLSATQASFFKLSSLSLFSYLR